MTDSKKSTINTPVEDMIKESIDDGFVLKRTMKYEPFLLYNPAEIGADTPKANLPHPDTYEACRVIRTLEDLYIVAGHTHLITVNKTIAIPDKKDGNGNVVSYKQTQRCRDAFSGTCFIVVDVDNSEISNEDHFVTPELFHTWFPSIKYYLIYSMNHMKVGKNGEAPRPKFHAYFPLSKFLNDVDKYKSILQLLFNMRTFIAECGKNEGKRVSVFDTSIKDASRIIYRVPNPDGIDHCNPIEGEDSFHIYLDEVAPVQAIINGTATPTKYEDNPASSEYVPNEDGIGRTGMTLAEAKDRLAVLDPDTEYSEFMKVMFAVHNEFPTEDGFDLMDSYASGNLCKIPSKKYLDEHNGLSGREYLRKQWDAIKDDKGDGNITIKTLCGMSKAAGYLPACVKAYDKPADLSDKSIEDIAPSKQELNHTVFGCFPKSQNKLSTTQGMAEVAKDLYGEELLFVYKDNEKNKRIGTWYKFSAKNGFTALGNDDNLFIRLQGITDKCDKVDTSDLYEYAKTFVSDPDKNPKAVNTVASKFLNHIKFSAQAVNKYGAIDELGNMEGISVHEALTNEKRKVIATPDGKVYDLTSTDVDKPRELEKNDYILLQTAVTPCFDKQRIEQFEQQVVEQFFVNSDGTLNRGKYNLYKRLIGIALLRDADRRYGCILVGAKEAAKSSLNRLFLDPLGLYVTRNGIDNNDFDARKRDVSPFRFAWATQKGAIAYFADLPDGFVFSNDCFKYLLSKSTIPCVDKYQKKEQAGVDNTYCVFAEANQPPSIQAEDMQAAVDRVVYIHLYNDYSEESGKRNPEAFRKFCEDNRDVVLGIEILSAIEAYHDKCNLNIPNDVKAEKDKDFGNQNPIIQFMADSGYTYVSRDVCDALGKPYKVKFNDLYNDWVDWCMTAEYSFTNNQLAYYGYDHEGKLTERQCRSKFRDGFLKANGNRVEDVRIKTAGEENKVEYITCVRKIEKQSN